MEPREDACRGQVPDSGWQGEQTGFAGLAYNLLAPDSGLEPRSPLIDEAYCRWRAIWEPTFFELTGLSKLHSDEFSRQHELVTVFREGRCVGLTGFRYIDLDSAVTRHDSYFASWPDEAYAAAHAWGREACIIGNFMVTPEHRGRRGGLSLSEIVTVLSLHRLATSRANVALVTTRNDRRVNELMYRYGARPLFENATMHGVSVDLVAFPREETAAMLRAPSLKNMIHQLVGPAGERSSQ